MTAEFGQDARNTVRRIPDRGSYDRETVYEILDAGFLCHIGFAVDGQTFVIPTLYGRSTTSSTFTVLRRAGCTEHWLMACRFA